MFIGGIREAEKGPPDKMLTSFGGDVKHKANEGSKCTASLQENGMCTRWRENFWDRRQGLPSTYCVPLAITEQRGVRDLGPALAKVKHEVEAALLELEDSIVHLVLMSHVVNEATGGECPDVQLNLEPEREQEVSARDQDGWLSVFKCNL